MLLSSALSPGGAGPDRRHRRGVDRSLHARAQGLLEHDPRPLDAEREDLRPGGRQVSAAGQVKKAVDPTHRPAHRAAVQDVGPDGLDVEPGQRIQ